MLRGRNYKIPLMLMFIFKVSLSKEQCSQYSLDLQEIITHFQLSLSKDI